MSPNLHSNTQTRIWPAAVYVVLIAIGIPWYWPATNYKLIAGFPAWVVIAIGVSFVASCFTAWLLRGAWPNSEGDTSRERRD